VSSLSSESDRQAARFLRGLEELRVPKVLRREAGGGRREFTIAEAESFRDIEDTEKFLSRCYIL
jgi:hypothetical protein